MPALGVVRAAGAARRTPAAADARYVSLAVLKWIDRHPDRPLVVLSGRNDEGRTAVTGNLAVALAEAGQRRHAGRAAVEPRRSSSAILFAAQKRTPPRPRHTARAAEAGAQRLAAVADAVGPAPGVTRLPAPQPVARPSRRRG